MYSNTFSINIDIKTNDFIFVILPRANNFNHASTKIIRRNEDTRVRNFGRLGEPDVSRLRASLRSKVLVTPL